MQFEPTKDLRIYGDILFKKGKHVSDSVDLCLIFSSRVKRLLTGGQGQLLSVCESAPAVIDPRSLDSVQKPISVEPNARFYRLCKPILITRQLVCRFAKMPLSADNESRLGRNSYDN